MIDRVGDILKLAAASVVMPRFSSLLPLEIEIKSENEPVTIADREAEALITRELLALIPGSRVVGEEACAANSALLEGISEGSMWVVDPIDGTANFAARRAPFAMMVALLKAGKTVGSWIYDPQRDRLAVAELGSGAWIDGERMTARPATPDRSQWHGIVSRAFMPDAQCDMVEAITALVGRADPTARCAGYEYPLVAQGERDFALYWRTLVWDHAPGVLLLTEAGGCATHFDGTLYNPTVARSGLLLTHDATVAETLLALTRAR